MEQVEQVNKSLSEDWKFLEKIYKILFDGNAFATDPTQKIVEFVQPNELKSIIDLSLNENGMKNKEEVLRLCELVVQYSVKTNHPQFHNQLYGQMDPYGLVGTWISEALNTSAYTFEVAPVFSLIETEIIRELCKIVGYENGDGIFAPGGSISNMYGMVLARYKKVPNVKEKGLSGVPPLVMFTSEESHYSFKKGAHWLGIGTENYIMTKTDQFGRMCPKDLEDKILIAKQDGKLPFFVNATAGTTVLGAFDRIGEIADICEKYGLWLHVDACHGGGVLLSQENRHLLTDVSRADSIAWDPHKALGAPLQCAVFLAKEDGLLSECNSTDASYLFQPDKYYDVSYDTGNKSIQCGRKIDAFKLWLMLKARGLMTFGSLVDHAIRMAKLLREKLSNRPGFCLVQDQFDYTNICFWYIPRRLRRNGEVHNQAWWNEVFKVPSMVKEKMVHKGSLMVGYSPLKYRGLGNFFRMVFTCFPILEESDLEFILNEIEQLAEQ